ncbi:hypothetical protein HT031_004212 [Scenedesmus sp. PABB004]|nr:hypothetical protein HT031_004212 [Scenedesmus sp. PABB004]
MAAAASALDSQQLDGELERALAGLSAALEGEAQPAAAGRALAVLTLLLSRAGDGQLPAIHAALPAIHAALGVDDQLVQANACAALTAAAALDDGLAASVAADCTPKLVGLLRSCEGRGGELQLNVVSALGQLARDQQPAVQAVMQPEALPCLLRMADASQPLKLQEAVADGLCALASHEAARDALCGAGAVPAAAALLAQRGDLGPPQLEVCARALLVLGMLLPGRPPAAAQLAAAPGALRALLALLRQGGDVDCRVLARDVLGQLLKDDALKPAVEAELRGGGEAS